jgi:hypothetical protein
MFIFEAFHLKINLILHYFIFYNLHTINKHIKKIGWEGCCRLPEQLCIFIIQIRQFKQIPKHYARKRKYHPRTYEYPCS